MSRRVPILVENTELLSSIRDLLRDTGQFSFPILPYLRRNTRGGLSAQNGDLEVNITAVGDLKKLVELSESQLRANSLSDPYSTLGVCFDADSEGEWRTLFEGMLGEACSKISDGSYWVRFSGREACRVVPVPVASDGEWGKEFAVLLGFNLPPIEADLNTVEKLRFEYGNFDEEVSEWLKQNPSAHQLLLQAPAEIEKVFNKGFQLGLEVFTPHDSRDPKALSVGIYTTLPAEEAVEKLETFEENWFLDRFMELPLGTQLFFNLRFE
jgi:hypothetical protein